MAQTNATDDAMTKADFQGIDLNHGDTVEIETTNGDTVTGTIDSSRGGMYDIKYTTESGKTTYTHLSVPRIRGHVAFLDLAAKDPVARVTVLED